jgi:cytochrome c-type biogenesis protein CcmE
VKRKHQRLAVLAGAMLLLAGAAAMALSALQDNIVFFYSPSDIVAKGVPPGKRFRIGGLVAAHSVKHLDGGSVVRFEITDTKRSVPVTYRGILPDLFREGQGVVCEGELRPDGMFVASQVLAKHDARYMPPEVVEALKKAGRWQEGARK